MGRIPIPLPHAPLTFSWGEGQNAGLSTTRHRAPDIRKTPTGLWMAAERWEQLEQSCTNSMHHLQIAEAQHFLHRRPELRISHVSALRLLGLPVPGSLSRDEDLHLTSPDRGWRIRRPGVVGHRAELADEDLFEVDGIPATSPVRTLLDVARSPHIHDVELIGISDALVRVPHWREGRADPWVTLHELADYINRHPGSRGTKKVKRILPRVRVGADSPAETYLRCAIEDAGLHVPELQVPVADGQGLGFTADTGYRELKIAIQYDGSAHFAAERGTTDRRRDREFTRAGWVVLHAVREDYREGFRSFLLLLAELIAERSNTSAKS